MGAIKAYNLLYFCPPRGLRGEGYCLEGRGGNHEPKGERNERRQVFGFLTKEG